MAKQQKISIILPVLNERDGIAESLSHLLSLGADEVVVVDGQSHDGTDSIVRRQFPGVLFLQTDDAKRALQMNAGAAKAQGDILIFMHADMRLPEGALKKIRHAIYSGAIAGGFQKQYHPAGFLLRAYAFCLNLFYFRGLRSMAGTNAMFVRRDVFESLGRFRDVILFEDLMLSDRLKREGRIAALGGAPVRVSSRRYRQRGILRQILVNFRVLLGYRLFGEDIDDLKKKYVSGYSSLPPREGQKDLSKKR